MTVKKKKKHRRYKLVWPKSEHKGPHRHIRKSVLIGFIVIVLGIAALITVPKIVDDSKLKGLGYDKTEIKAIRSLKLKDTILDNKYYSDYLAQSLKDGTVNTDYLELYTVVSSDRGLSNQDFLLYSRLADKGYEPVQILNLFSKLRFWEITPLLVFDYQYDETGYIKDCQDHADTNSQNSFSLTKSYYTHYGTTLPVEDTGAVNMLVNKTYYLPETYEPPGLTDLSIQYASEGRQLASVAADALYTWADAGIAVGVRFYAASAYRSYASQESIYNSYLSSMGQEQTDALSARAGYSEHQTGYTVDIAAVGEDDKPEYKDTNAYVWTSNNCQDYGWILRYPEGKTSITGYEFESWHYRYLGVDLAKAVTDSKLTYDEYYCLYLKGWDDEANKPSQAILNATSYSYTAEPSASPETTASAQ